MDNKILGRKIHEAVRKTLSELDWKTYANAAKKADKLSKEIPGKYESKRKSNQARDFNYFACKKCDKQFGTDVIRKKKEDFERDEKNKGKDYEYTNGELRRLQRQGDDVENFYSGNMEYKNGKWGKKTNESKAIKMNEDEFKKLIGECIKKSILKETFINNQNYTHFAVNKSTNKIVNGWDYSDYDPSELRQFKKDYFDVDLIDYGFNPKDYRIVTSKYLLRQGIDPDDNENWANE